MHRRILLKVIAAIPLAFLPKLARAELPVSPRERFERAWVNGGPAAGEWEQTVRELRELLAKDERFRNNLVCNWLRKGIPTLNDPHDVQPLFWLFAVGAALRDVYSQSYVQSIIILRLGKLTKAINDFYGLTSSDL